MPESYDLIIIGGGIVGAAAAYRAARLGACALLVDRHDPGRATDAGAGILAPEMNKRDPDAWFNFAIEAVDHYPELVELLAEDDAGEPQEDAGGQSGQQAEQEAGPAPRSWVEWAVAGIRTGLWPACE